MIDYAQLPQGQKMAATRTVEKYLTMLGSQSPRGRRTPEHMKERLADVMTALDGEPGALGRLLLIQERMDLEQDLAVVAAVDHFDEIQRQFIEVAAGWGAAKGITVSAWRAMKVPAAVLKEAGIS